MEPIAQGGEVSLTDGLQIQAQSSLTNWELGVSLRIEPPNGVFSHRMCEEATDKYTCATFNANRYYTRQKMATWPCLQCTITCEHHSRCSDHIVRGSPSRGKLCKWILLTSLPLNDSFITLPQTNQAITPTDRKGRKERRNGVWGFLRAVNIILISVIVAGALTRGPYN